MARLPKVKLRAIPVFPSNVTGITGVAVDKANGAYSIGLDVSGFHISNVPADETATTYAIAHGGVTTDNPKGEYSRVPFSGFQGASSDLTSLAELATFGIVARIGDANYATRTNTGTANRITVTNGGGIAGNPTFDISVSYVGQTSITTLGTIATGVWQATVIGATYGGFGANVSASSGVPLFATGVPTFTATSGTGNFVRVTNTALVTPDLGTPSAAVLTNATGTAAGLTAGHVTTNANLTGDVTSVGNATTLAAGNAGNLNSGTLLAARMPALTGDITTSAGAVATTLATVNSNVGTFGSATQAAQVTVNGKGLVTAAANVTITPAIGSITGLGTGVATALGINIGSAGAPVTFNGAGGTPSSITLTNAGGTAAGLTAGNVTTNANQTGAITSVGNATSLGSFTSANLRTALTDETGTGAAVFGTNPTFADNITVTNGVAATTFNNVGMSSLGSTSAIIMGSAKTAQFLSSLSLTGTDGTTMTFPTTSATLARTDAANTFTGTQTIGALVATTVNGNTITTGTGVLTLGAGKTATISNTLTFTGTDSSSVALGAGGTVLYNGGALGTPSSGVGTNITNVNAATLGGATFSAPGAIGGGTSSAGTFTTLVATTVNGVTIDNNAWTQTTPTPSPGTGSFTSASCIVRCKQIGKLVFIQAQITITTNGTGASFIYFAAPVAELATISQALTGREGINGFNVNAFISGGIIYVKKYDGTYPGATGNIISVSGVYEAA